MALPIWANSLRNLLPSRTSRNSHPAVSRSTQHSTVDVGSRARLVSRSRKTKPMEHPHRSANQVLSNEITSDFFNSIFRRWSLVPSKRSDLWVIESAAGGLQAGNPAAFLISISSYRRSLSVPVPTFVSLCSTRSYERRNQRDTNNYIILVWLGDVPMRRLAAMPIGTSNPHTRLSPCTLTDCSPGKPAVPHGGVRRVTLYYVFVTTDLSI